MSRCPDWRRLDPADRDAPGATPAAARWREALQHFDGGCPLCRQAALVADPTLIFRRLPVPDLGPAQEAGEVEAARAAVAAMRTASRVAGRVEGRAVRDSRGLAVPGAAVRRALEPLRALQTLQLPHAARWALAAGLTAIALIFGSGHGWHPGALPAVTTGPALASGAADRAGSPAPDRAGSLVAAAPFQGAPSAVTPGAAGRATSGVLPASSRPSIEGLSRPNARVYQLDSPHMSVVMIVDDKLDV